MRCGRAAIALLLVLASGACAAGRPDPRARGLRFREADARLPPVSVFPGEAERILYRDALAAAQRGKVAERAGDLDQARTALVVAARGLVAVVERGGPSEWQLPLRRGAVELLLEAQEWAPAAEQAERLAADPAASDRTRALALQLAAHAWATAAAHEVRAGRLEPLRLTSPEARGGAPLVPRAPSGPWRRLVAAADAYLALPGHGPEGALPPGGLLLSPARLALAAAQIHYGHDNVEEACDRLGALLRRWPDDEVAEQARSLHRETSLLLGALQGDAPAAGELRRIPEAAPGLAPAPERLSQPSAGPPLPAAPPAPRG